jgi:hypothetical protein
LADFLGIGYEIWGFFSLIFLAVIYLVFKFRGRDIPVKVLWIFKNRAAVLLPAKEDFAGVFLDIFSSRRRKKLTSISKFGLPLEVKIVPEKTKAYLIPNDGGIPKVGYDIHLGGLQTMRMYVTTEGTGETLDFIDQNDGEQNLHSTIINEEVGASQALIRMVKEEVGTSLKAQLIPLGAGVGLGSAFTFVVMLFFGKLH